MTNLLDPRADGSVAVFIDGVLQFEGAGKVVEPEKRKAARATLVADREETVILHSALIEELSAYELDENDEVLYGVQMLSRPEAIRKTQEALWKANLKISTIDAQIARLPISEES